MNAAAQWVLGIGDRTIEGLFVWSWQATILFTCVWLFLKFSRLRSPALRHRTWLVGLIALATLPLAGQLTRKVPAIGPHPNLNYVIEAPRAVVNLAAPPATKIQPIRPVGEPSKTSVLGFFKPLLFASWLIGLLLQLAGLIKQQTAFGRIRRKATPVSAIDLEARACPPGVPLRLSKE